MNGKNNEENKIVLFPGLTDRLLTTAVQYAENQQYEAAIDIFEQLFEYADGDEYSLSMFIHCLYEVKKYERAKDICELLIALEPDNYFEVMELYLTICMQLKQYLQVEKIIHSLFERDLIPSDQIEKFQRIQSLNEEIAEKRQFEEDKVRYEETDFFEQLEEKVFLQKSELEQLMLIQELGAINIRPYTQSIFQLLEQEKLHAFLKSLLLIVLVEQQIEGTVIIEKWGLSEHVQLKELALPTDLPQFQVIQQRLEETYGKDPTVSDLVMNLLIKHAIVAYPFEWTPFSVEDVVNTYQHFVDEMFGQEVLDRNTAIFEFIKQLEKLSELE